MTHVHKDNRRLVSVLRNELRARNSIATLLALSLSILIASPAAMAQRATTLVYAIQPGSELWFDGSSTVNRFTCRNHTVSGFGTITSVEKKMGDITAAASSVKGVFYTEVSCMSCGLAPMDEDMYKALKAEQYPEIRFVLDSVRLLEHSSDADSLIDVKAAGELTIAGRTNFVDIPVKVAVTKGDTLVMEGSEALSMRDYGITPPTALWGLIKASDKLTVHFRLIAAPAPEHAGSQVASDASTSLNVH